MIQAEEPNYKRVESLFSLESKTLNITNHGVTDGVYHLDWDATDALLSGAEGTFSASQLSLAGMVACNLIPGASTETKVACGVLASAAGVNAELCDEEAVYTLQIPEGWDIEQTVFRYIYRYTCLLFPPLHSL